MGILKRVYEVTNGFRFDRFAEDIEFSIRIRKAGFKVGLIADAFVYHKRRTSFSQFAKQVFNFGKGRALVGSVHPEEVKITHWFPALFTLGSIFIPVLFLLSRFLFNISLAVFGGYLFLIFLHSLALNRNLFVACLSVPSALLQLWGYGVGFVYQTIQVKRKRQ
jgi:GT2 family glycosyltransferase